MSKIHFLQVKYGDAFVIECSKSGNLGVVVVDGGPTGCGYVLQNKLKEIGTPDLLVLTHYDDDHIGGILQHHCWGQAPRSSIFWKLTAGVRP